MTRRRWTITTYASGRKRIIDLVVYRHIGILRREATRFAKHIHDPQADFSQAAGVCHGFDRVYVHADGTETPYPHTVTIRLVVGHLTPLVISHEIAHAAQHMYRLDILRYDNTDPATDHYDAGNENFAHLYGEIFAAIWGTLNRAGLIETGANDG